MTEIELQQILFDEAHGQRRWGETGFPAHTANGMYLPFAEFAETALSLIPKCNTELFSADVLGQARIVVVPNPTGRLVQWQWIEEPDTKLKKAECQSLWNFVAQGGSLVILAHRHADEFTHANLNELAQPFGFEFSPKVFITQEGVRKGESWAPVTTNVEKHPITEHVHVVCLNYCCPIRITNAEVARPLLWPPTNLNQLNITGEPQNESDVCAAVVSAFGSGKVVAFGSDVMFGRGLDEEHQDFHNDRLLFNTLRFLASDMSESQDVASPKVFLSHQSSDKEFTRKLAHDLLKRGFDVWFDEFRLRIGDSLTDSIDRAVGECDFFVLVISEAALESKWVSKEYASANAHMLDGGCLKILPAVIDDCQLPTFLKDLLWADFRNDYGRALELLGSAIEEHFAQRQTEEK